MPATKAPSPAEKKATATLAKLKAAHKGIIPPSKIHAALVKAYGGIKPSAAAAAAAAAPPAPVSKAADQKPKAATTPSTSTVKRKR